MRRMRGMFKSVGVFLAVAMAALVLAVPASALDKLHLKDGRVLEGRIARELPSGAIYFEISVGSLTTGDWYNPEDIRKVVRDEALAAEEAAAEERKKEEAIPDGAMRIAFISLEEMVGPFFNKDAIEHSMGILEELPEYEQPDIVVFVINSGGGALYELEKIVTYLHEEVKPKYRTVAWIRSAISAAAMTAWVIDELYMMTQANIGACTGFSMQGGTAEAVDGEALERVLMFMEQVSAWGGRSDQADVMRAMQIFETLSATKNPDGTVEWFLDDSGDVIISPEDEILTLTAIQAVEWNVADAIADTKDELAKAMGCAEWVEVGQKADEYQREFRENVGRAQVKIQELSTKLNMALNFAGSAPTAEERNRNVGEARRYLGQMRFWVNRAPSLKFYMGLTDEWFREMERRIRDLATGR